MKMKIMMGKTMKTMTNNINNNNRKNQIHFLEKLKFSIYFITGEKKFQYYIKNIQVIMQS
jgi:hypothetical protein